MKQHITAAHRRNLRWVEKALAGRTSVPLATLMEDLGAQVPPGFAARSREIHAVAQRRLYARKFKHSNRKTLPRGSKELVRVGQRRHAREIVRPFVHAGLFTREVVDGVDTITVTEKYLSRMEYLNGTG